MIENEIKPEDLKKMIKANRNKIILVLTGVFWFVNFLINLIMVKTNVTIFKGVFIGLSWKFELLSDLFGASDFFIIILHLLLFLLLWYISFHFLKGVLSIMITKKNNNTKKSQK